MTAEDINIIIESEIVARELAFPLLEDKMKQLENITETLVLKELQVSILDEEIKTLGK